MKRSKLWWDGLRAKRAESGGAVRLTVLAAGSVLVAAALTALLIGINRVDRSVSGKSLLLYCAAGLRVPAEQIVRDYSHRYGVSVRLQFGPSNTLLSQIEASQTGDLFLAPESSYAHLGRKKGLIEEVIPVASLRPVLAVPRGNPQQITGFETILEKRLRLAFPNPDQAACGKLARDCLEESGLWPAVEELVRTQGVFKPTVADSASDVALGGVDAAVVWDAILPQYPSVEGLTEPVLNRNSTAAICVLRFAKDPTAALHFARYLAAKDRGLEVFRSLGYAIVEGDCWAEVPEINFFVGSVNRRAIEETIKEFQNREGVVVNTVYNGCGILTAQMHSIREKGGSGFPDAYLACDVYYLDNVRDWFQEAVNISNTEVVMVVPKGNPKEIGSLEDLTRPGIRVVVGQPEQCTIGALTRRLLQQEGLYDRVMANVVSQTPTSAMLVPAVTTGAADVALAYATDAQAESARIDVIQIPSPYTEAIQPFAIARSTEYKNLARRLFDALVRNAQRFKTAGFQFRLQDSEFGLSCCLLEPWTAHTSPTKLLPSPNPARP